MPTWLIKSEPDAYSFDQLTRDTRTAWTGVRNYTARNNLRAMKEGDLALFYHSNVGKAVVGIAKVVREAYKEVTDEGDWSAVDFAPVRPLTTPVTLDAMRVHPTLKDMVLFKQGRLSVVPVTQAQFDTIVALADVPAKTSVTPKTKPLKSVGRPAKPKKRAKSIVAKKAPERVAPKKGAGPKARKRAKSSR